MLLQCDSNEHPHWTRSTLIPTSCPGSISIFAASISIVCWLQSQIYSSEFIRTCDFRDFLLADMSVSIIHGHTFATNPKVDGQTCEKTSCSPGILPELGVNLYESPFLPLSQTPQRPCCALNGKCQELRHLLHPFIDPRPAKNPQKKAKKWMLKGSNMWTPCFSDGCTKHVAKKRRPKRDDEFWGCLAKYRRKGKHHDSSWQKCVSKTYPRTNGLNQPLDSIWIPNALIICSWSMLKTSWPIHQLWTLEAAIPSSVSYSLHCYPGCQLPRPSLPGVGPFGTKVPDTRGPQGPFHPSEDHQGVQGKIMKKSACYQHMGGSIVMGIPQNGWLE